MRRIFSVVFLVSMVISCSSSKEIKTDVTDKINLLYEKGKFNGFAVAIVRENGILYQHGFGYADVKNWLEMS